MKLEELLARNPYLSRREALKLAGIGMGTATLSAGCAKIGMPKYIPEEDKVSFKPIIVPGAKNIQRKGPDLHYRPKTGRYGTAHSHVFFGADPGTDFVVGDVYPVANGVVTVVKEWPNSGKLVTVYHGPYWSVYMHLAEQLVSVGQRVTRRDKIGIGGATGEGAKGEPHIHLGLLTDNVAQLINAFSSKGNGDDFYYFDPVDFAAFKGVKDSNGNLTLPYSYGEEIDGPLDDLFKQHHQAKSRVIDNAVAKFPGSEIGHLYKHGVWSMVYGLDGDITEKILFLHERIRSGKHPFTPNEVERVSTATKELLSYPLLATAPKRNLDMPQLYK